MKTNLINTGMLLAAAFVLAGCGSMLEQNRTVHYSSSLYSYLNTNETRLANSPAPVPAAGPLKIAIAFVPSEYTSTAVGKASIPGETLSLNDKMILLQQIADEFKKCPSVKSVELLPSTYLSPGGGFENLKHIGATFGVNTMILIAYDQTQFSDEGLAAFSYWTIIGAYTVPGERNSTVTVLEAGMYDIAGDRMLMRASGTSTLKGSATPVNLSEELRADSKRGFETATTNLVITLRTELTRFSEQRDKPIKP
jgi:rhombotail lipoprotein